MSLLPNGIQVTNMIDFMVLALPRSGTAWVANLLTTDTSLCIHEAFMDHSIDDLDNRPHDGLLGIAETLTLSETALSAAFRQAGRVHHPDEGGSEKEFSQIGQAYQIH